MLRPLEQWCCDSCGRVVEGAWTGCLEWQTTHATGTVSGFRLVHKTRECTYDQAELALARKRGTLIPLDMVMGPAGLGSLLQKLSDVMKGDSMRSGDLQAFIELVRRVQVPYYEEARLAWRTGMDEGVHNGMSFDDSTLRRIIHWKDATVAAWVAMVTGRDVVPPMYQSVEPVTPTSHSGSAPGSGSAQV